jgi:DNA/RNA-binding domain of Phe-tRNA-synthetase-like protein
VVVTEEALASEFPGLRVVELVLEGLTVRASDPALEAWKPQVYAEVRADGPGLEAVRDDPQVKAYRDFYWRVGVDPTKTRPAAEALRRRVLGGRDIPSINSLVDAYNLVSLRLGVAVAAFDAERIHPDALLLRRARAGESFLGIGMSSRATLAGVEVVLEDLASHELEAIYPYRDAERSKVSVGTTRAFLLMCGVPGITDESLERTRAECERAIRRFCTGAPS